MVDAPPAARPPVLPLHACDQTRVCCTPQALSAAEELRTSLRQGLSEVVAQAANKSAEWVAAAQAELEQAGANASTLLQRLSSMPVKFDANGACACAWIGVLWQHVRCSHTSAG